MCDALSYSVREDALTAVALSLHRTAIMNRNKLVEMLSALVNIRTKYN